MQRLTQKNWLRLGIAPIVAIAVVVAAIVGTDLATGGAGEPKIENQAPVFAGMTPGTTVPRTPRPTTARTPTGTPAPTAAPTAVPSPIAEILDQTRKDDLQQIAAALEKYYDKKKEYPTTGGNLQTVCTYEEIDAGCKLKDFLDPIPSDPRGDAAQNGYWYASDGKSYSLIAIVDLEANSSSEACPDTATKHTGKPETRLYCLSGSH